MKWLRKIVRPRFLLACLIIILLAEVCCRLLLGLGKIPVYREDAQYEYIYASDQDLYRFGNHIVTNSFGLRCGEPQKSDRVRILKIGDSVINGGPHVDQDNLSSSKIEKELSAYFRKSIRCFNLSAQSWGPDNAFSFIKKHGDFDSQIFVMVFSSHDLHDNMHFKKVVGNHAAWPDKQPWSALSDGITRYLIPRVKTWLGKRNEEYDYLFDFDDSKINPGWNQLITYARYHRIVPIVYLHATRQELQSGTYDQYGLKLLEMLKNENVYTIQGIRCITASSAYRDNIHLNTRGHELLAKELVKELKPCVDSLLHGN